MWHSDWNQEPRIKSEMMHTSTRHSYFKLNWRMHCIQTPETVQTSTTRETNQLKHGPIKPKEYKPII